MLVTSALISGLGLGSMYGLLALGFHVTRAVSNTVNFAQGSTMMLGAVLCFTFWVTFQWPLTLAVIAALALSALWGAVVERVAVRPFVQRGSNAWLLATVALGIVLENVVLFTFGKDPRGMPPGILTTNSVSVAGIRIQLMQILIPIVGLMLAAGLHLFFHRSRYGKALLAVVQNKDAARLMGIDVECVVMASFALSGFLAGIAGAAILVGICLFLFRADGYQLYVIALVGLTTIVGVGLNVLLGMTGQISLGHAAFYAIGAYAVGILTTTLDWSFWIALPLAGLIAGIAGILLAIPALRVRGPYLAMVTIAFGFVVEQGAAEWSDLTGGWNGILGIPMPTALGFSFSQREVGYLAGAFTALSLYLYARLSGSPSGQA